jgi:excisionase family DNA binding protein
MNNEILTKESEIIKTFFKSSQRILDNIDLLVENSKPRLNGERFLTDKEVSEKLKISRRTLQDYRTQGKIAYIQLGGKILYKESDIEKMLESGYQESIE